MLTALKPSANWATIQLPFVDFGNVPYRPFRHERLEGERCETIAVFSAYHRQCQRVCQN
jgi:hypothetical protein